MVELVASPEGYPIFVRDDTSQGLALPVQGAAAGMMGAVRPAQAIYDFFANPSPDRFQFWPERIARSGLSLPVEVMNGSVLSSPGLRRGDSVDTYAQSGMEAAPYVDESTWLGRKLGLKPIAAEPQDPLIERAQDIAALGGVGTIASVKPTARLPLPEPIDWAALQRQHYQGYAMSDTSKPGMAIAGAKEGLKLTPVEGNPFAATNLTREQLERMNIDDLDRMAFGHSTDERLQLNSSDIKIKYKDDLVNPQDKFDKKGMGWVNSVDFSEPVKVSIGQDGKFYLENGHHRWFAANKLNKPIDVIIEKIDGKPIEKILKDGVLTSDTSKPGMAIAALKQQATELQNKLIADKKAGLDIKPVQEQLKTIKDKMKELETKPEVPAATAPVSKEGFYSQLDQSLLNTPMKVGAKEQWVNELKRYGSTVEEIEHTLNNLPEGQITKQQLEKHVAENKVEVNEIIKQKIDNTDRRKIIEKRMEAIQDEFNNMYKLPDSAELAKKRQDLSNEKNELYKNLQNLHQEELEGTRSTKWSRFQLPGGENYKETLLTLPDNREFKSWYNRNWNPRGDTSFESLPHYTKADVLKDYDLTRNLAESSNTKGILNEVKTIQDVKDARNFNSWFREATKGKTEEEALKLIEEARKLPSYQAPYQSPHWSEPNVVVHTRTNDRFIPDPEGPSLGGTKVAKRDNVVPDEIALKKYGQEWDSLVKKKQELTEQQDTMWKNEGNKNTKAYNKLTDEIDAVSLKLDELHDKGVNETISRIENGNKGLRSYHIEENQSDMHQSGAKQGYKLSPEMEKKLEPEFNRIDNKIIDAGDEAILGHPDIKTAVKMAVDKNIITKDEAKTYLKYSDSSRVGAVPDAPFKNFGWVDLAIKHALKKAAEGGYDAISWTPGEAQTTAQLVKKHVKEIEYIKNQDGTYKLGVTDKNGEGVTIPNGNKMSLQKIEDTFGKEIAQKIKDNEGKKFRGHEGNTLEGLDLETGIEFHKKLYDEMMVNKVNAIAKKYGGKVEKVDLPDTNPKGWHITPPERTTHGKWMVKSSDYNSKGFRFDTEAEAKANLIQQIEGERTPKQSIWVLKLPPQLKQDALTKGFPLFSGGISLTPVQDDPFKRFKLTPVEGNPFKVQ